MKLIKKNIINFIVILSLEIIFKILLRIDFNISEIISVVVFSLFTSFLITFITNIFSEKVNRILMIISYFLLSLLFALQYVFKSFIRCYFSLAMIKLSDQAVGFLGTTLTVILSKIIYILILFIPFIVILIIKKKLDYHNDNKKRFALIYVILIVISYGIYNLSLNLDKNRDLSLSEIYHDINNPDLSVPRLGVLPGTMLNVYYELFSPHDELKLKDSIKDDKVSSENKNILELDLSDSHLDKDVKKYIENNLGTNKNEYTGYFEGKNLILLVAESFSEVVIDEELTPTLYKLTHSGFTFDNFYVPYYLSTIGGEYQTLTGLYPSSDILTTWKSGENAFPYGIATKFEENGYKSYSYHGHDGHFQNRYKYLKALGFDSFRACNMNLDIDCEDFPESDLEMIDKSYSDYMNSDDNFIAYYMTVSGHLYYNFTTNDMAIKNKDYVKDLDYSKNVKAYVAAHIELDKALELLIDKLEESGKLDDTVIIMLADHYPYGLELDELNELSSYERDDIFEKNHNSLIIWNNNMEKTNISKVGMPIDVLPTIYNLFGIEYDSRLFAGNDLFSDSEGLAIFNDLSWITDKGKYLTSTDTYSTDYDKEYINKINNTVHDRLLFSKNILLNDSYKYIK